MYTGYILSVKKVYYVCIVGVEWVYHGTIMCVQWVRNGMSNGYVLGAFRVYFWLLWVHSGRILSVYLVYYGRIRCVFLV